jgi:hypothetical protein
MKKTLYKPQAGDVDINVEVYTNESCKTPNRNCTNHVCKDSPCDGSIKWPKIRNDPCVNYTCINDPC